MTQVVQGAVAASSTCARRKDGAVWCWGYNGEGEVGDGTGVNSVVPVLVPGLSSSGWIVGGSSESCSIATDSTVACWGRNFHGKFGNGTTLTAWIPTPLGGVTGL